MYCQVWIFTTEAHLESGQSDPSEKLLNDPDFTDNMSQTLQKALRLVLSLLSGLFYGANFFPITLAVEQGLFDSRMDATFSHFTGILGTHLIYFIIYSVYTHVSLYLDDAILPFMM